MTQRASKKPQIYKFGEENQQKAIEEMVNTFIQNPHYDLKVTMDRFCNLYCKTYDLMPQQNKNTFLYQFLKVLKTRIEKEIQRYRGYAIEDMEKMLASLQSEIEYAKTDLDYIPSVDRDDIRMFNTLKNTDYYVTRFRDLFSRLEQEIDKMNSL